jgi:hypothetical protein
MRFLESRYCSNQSEVFLKASDKWEMRNIAGHSAATSVLGWAIVEEWLPIAVSVGRCKGTECNAPVAATDYNRSSPLPCHNKSLVGDAMVWL